MPDVVATIGSSRRNGNTEILARMVLKKIAERGFRTELIPLADKHIEFSSEHYPHPLKQFLSAESNVSGRINLY